MAPSRFPDEAVAEVDFTGWLGFGLAWCMAFL
jgi:hypothetical protein